MILTDSERQFLEEIYADPEFQKAEFESWVCHMEEDIAYLQGWLQALKNDMTMIISACSKAQKAAGYILEHNEECNAKSLSSQISPSGRTGTIV